MSIEAHASKVPEPPVDASIFWTLDRVASALAPHARTKLPRGSRRLGRVSTDTRSIQKGDLFVALIGEKFDAHNFVRDAVKAGSAAVVVSRVDGLAGLGVPIYDVDDTRAALGSLGRYRRRAWKGPIVGVVGTNGKTSTKELIRAALDSRLEVHATTGNLNNLIGVPQTLLAIPDHADVAVVEMGTNQPGEIAALRAIVEPEIVVVTSIAEEHLEGLGDIAGVLREELSSTDGVGIAIVPANQPEVAHEARKRARRVLVAGLEANSDLTVNSWSLDSEGRGRLIVRDVEVVVPLRGLHNLRNAVLALAVARELGISTEDAARGIANMPVPPMRSNVEQLGRVTLINDAYNSNPGSARAALELLVHAGDDSSGTKRQRVAVLGTMLELGPTAPALHDQIARAALDAPVDVIAGVGEFAAALQRVNAPAERVVEAQDAEGVWPRLVSRLQPDAIILLKGSRGVRLERLVPLITRWAQDAS